MFQKLGQKSCCSCCDGSDRCLLGWQLKCSLCAGRAKPWAFYPACAPYRRNRFGFGYIFYEHFFNKLIRSFGGFKVFKNRSVLLQFPSQNLKTGFLPIQFFTFLFCKIQDSRANAKTEFVLPLTGICLIGTVPVVWWVVCAACPIQRSASRIHSHHNHVYLNNKSSSLLKSSKHHLVSNCPSKFGQGE